MEANNTKATREALLAMMREAVIAMLDERCKQCYINDQICTQGLKCHWNGKRGEICQDEAMDKAIAALSAPPRNCDRFDTGDVKRDAQDAMEAMLDEGVAGYRGIAEYLLSPVRTEQEGEANGSK